MVLALISFGAPGQPVHDVWRELGGSGSPLAVGIGAVGVPQGGVILLGPGATPLVCGFDPGGLQVCRWEGESWIRQGPPLTVSPGVDLRRGRVAVSPDGDVWVVDMMHSVHPNLIRGWRLHDGEWEGINPSSNPPEVLAEGTFPLIRIDEHGRPVVAHLQPMGAGETIRVWRRQGSAWVNLDEEGSFPPVWYKYYSLHDLIIGPAQPPLLAFYDSRDHRVSQLTPEGWTSEEALSAPSYRMQLGLDAPSIPLLLWTNDTYGTSTAVRLDLRSGSEWSEIPFPWDLWYSPEVLFASGPEGHAHLAWRYGIDLYMSRRGNGVWADVTPGSSTGGGITRAPGSCRFHDLAVDSQGRALLSWFGPNGRYFSLFENGGHRFLGGSPCGGISDDYNHRSTLPQVAIGPVGEPCVAWISSGRNVGGLEIRLRRWNGGSWVPLAEPLLPSTVNLFAPFVRLDLAVDAQGLPMVAVQSEYGPDGMAVARWDGTAWVELPDFPVAAAPAPSRGPPSPVSRDPALVFDTKGRPLLALVMATSPRGVGVARWNGSRWQGLASPEATHDLLPGDPAYGEGPAIALNAADQPVLVWPDGLELEARAFDGLRWIDLEFPAIPGTPRGAVVAVASPNAPVVAWSNVTASDRSEVFVLRRASEEWAEVGAHSATQEGISNTLPLSGAEGIGLCVDELGRITVAWTESLPYQASREVWVRQWDGQQWAEVGDGSAGDGGVPSCVNAATEPALACDGEGGLILAWAGQAGAGYDDPSDIFLRTTGPGLHLRAGDVNLDGRVDIADLVRLLLHLEGQPFPNATVRALADLDANGDLTAGDAQALGDLLLAG